jgi:hypothetical protein
MPNSYSRPAVPGAEVRADTRFRRSLSLKAIFITKGSFFRLT